MSSIIQEEPTDVLCLGLGVSSGFVAAEATAAGYKVVGIEKGPYWEYATDFATAKYDEWGVFIIGKFDHPLRLSTYTLRNNVNQFAMPVRRNTPGQVIHLGHGVGGMAQHYAGQMGRFGPWVYQMKSDTASRYGANFLNDIMPTNDVEDWPMTYEEYDPYYVEFEKAFGVTGTNQGPFQPQSQNYPLPPHPWGPIAQPMYDACEALGYHPYQTPTSLASEPYTNQYGVAINACVYDGWCGAACNYVCETGAKANSAYRTIPAAISTGNFTMALNSYVFRIDTDPSTGMATGARYYDAAGNIHVQPAKVVYNGLWGFNIVRTMRLSGIGNPYNNTTFQGSLGRAPSYGDPAPGVASVSGYLNQGANAYPAGNASGGGADMLDYADDNFDHTGLNFIGGAPIRGEGYYGSGPSNITGIAAGVSATAQGSTYKASLKDYYLPTKSLVYISMEAPDLADKRSNIDLDPHFTDLYGDPLARLTQDYAIQQWYGAQYLSGSTSSVAYGILQKMGCNNITVDKGVTPGSVPLDNWPAHTRGGARIGADPSWSVFNKYGQCWTCENLFAAGEITETTGDNTTIGGTHPMGAVAYVTTEGIKKYLASPGPLV
jgi:gluconate 2-dehydrogenase alpha chain